MWEEIKNNQRYAIITEIVLNGDGWARFMEKTKLTVTSNLKE